MIFLANLLTLLNFSCGFFSVILSLQGRLAFAAWMVLLSVLFDGLDGQAARLSSEANRFGKELDSFTDAISFGVAPVILGYFFVQNNLLNIFLISALFFYLLCGIIRLVKFNLVPKEEMKVFFYGLPITVSAGTLASFVLFSGLYPALPAAKILIFMILSLAILMVSGLRYPNLGFLKLLLRQRLPAIILFIAVFLAILYPKEVIFYFFLIYLTFAPFIVRLLAV